MSETSGAQQKEKVTKVRRKPERESVLQPTFAATRHSIDSTLADRDQESNALLQRQCACGMHTIAGSECNTCRQKRESHFLQRTTIKQIPHDGQMLGPSDTQDFRVSGSEYNFSHIPAHTTKRLGLDGDDDGIETNKGYQTNRKIPNIISSQNMIVQTFSPASHRGATAEGLSSSFSAEEIGAIYQSNWERDFSQGPKEIADMVLAWKAAKQSAAENGGSPSASVAATFRDKVWQVIDMDLLDSTNESLSGYYAWEHMDNPGGKGAEEADERWAGKGGNLPGYINDSKAYIKDEIVAAVDQYRSFSSKGEIGQDIDNWQGVEKPEGYSPQALDTAAWIGDDDAPTISTGVIANEAAQQAANNGARSKLQASWEKKLWRAIGYHLGRAMHATEDFFAHSNWLEVAKAYKTSSGTASTEIRTGTFEMPDKAHALGHKLFALSSQLLTDFNLLLKLYNRTRASTKLNPKERGNWFSGPNTNDFAFGPLETDSWTPVGEIMDIGIMADNMEELVQAGQLDVEDFLLNKDWLKALQSKGKILIEEGDKEAPETGHGKMAKDQDEPGKDHTQARAIAVEANKLIFDPLRNIMDLEDIEGAKEALLRQLELVDLIIAPPSDSHPLMNLNGEATGSASELGDYPLPSSNTRFA